MDDSTIGRLLVDDVDVVRFAAAAALHDRPQLHEVASSSPDK